MTQSRINCTQFQPKYQSTNIDTFVFEVLPEVFLGDVGAVPELAEVADPYVALEAHQDGAVD